MVHLSGLLLANAAFALAPLPIRPELWADL